MVDTGNALPIALPIQRTAWVERNRIQEEVTKMKEQSVIVESDSLWSNPSVLVRKKDGTI